MDVSPTKMFEIERVNPLCAASISCVSYISVGLQKARLNDRLIYMLLSFALFLPPLIGYANTGTSEESSAPVEFSEDNLISARNKIADIQTKITEAESRKQAQKKAITLNQKALQQSRLLIAKTDVAITQLVDQHARTTQDLESAQLSYDALYQSLLVQVRQTYQMGKWSQVKLIFNQENIQDAERYKVFQQYFHKASISKLNQLSTLENKLLELDETLKKESAALALIQGEQQKNTLEQEKTLAQNKKMIEALNNALNEMNQSLITLQQEEENIDQLLKRAARIESLKHSFTAQKGKLLWPLEDELAENSFNHLEEAIINTQGKGIVIEGEPHSRVKAIHEGKVVFSSWLRGFGQMLIINHGEGFLSLYGQNETLLKREGEWVLTGETIAILGNESRTPTGGLYFEIRQNGKAKNPLNWIAKR